MWGPLWPELISRFTAIRYDARGFGASTDPTGPFWLHEDAAEVLEAAGYDAAAVIGTSMGGSAALDLALERPDAVRALVLVGATPDGFDGDGSELQARFAEVDAALERGDVDGANQIEVEIWVDGVGRTGAPDPAARRAVAEVNGALLVRQAGFEAEPRELPTLAVERLHELAVPTLVVVGAHDQPVVLAGSRLIAERTGARMVTIEGTAHLPNLERPETFLSEVVPFLKGALD
jgi:pimeloyl-ACP methyl ester carboxylesterase